MCKKEKKIEKIEDSGPQREEEAAAEAKEAISRDALEAAAAAARRVTHTHTSVCGLKLLVYAALSY